MTRFGPRTLAALIISVAIVGTGIAVAGQASATEGKPVIAGTNNTATSTTAISDSTRSSVPLSLNVRSGAPPLSVNSRYLVKNLNAETVNGLRVSDIARAVTGRTGIIGNADAPAVCPKGTKLTGGGALAYTGADPAPLVPQPLFYSGPAFNEAGAFVSNAWDAGSTNSAATVVTIAICYNPVGPVPGDLGNTTAAFAKAAGKDAPSVSKLLAKLHP
jgi:hypothetical protein